MLILSTFCPRPHQHFVHTTQVNQHRAPHRRTHFRFERNGFRDLPLFIRDSKVPSTANFQVFQVVWLDNAINNYCTYITCEYVKLVVESLVAGIFLKSLPNKLDDMTRINHFRSVWGDLHNDYDLDYDNLWLPPSDGVEVVLNHSPAPPSRLGFSPFRSPQISLQERVVSSLLIHSTIATKLAVTLKC